MSTLSKGLVIVILVLSLPLGSYLLWSARVAGVQDRSVPLIAGATLWAIGLITAVVAVRLHALGKDMERFTQEGRERRLVRENAASISHQEYNRIEEQVRSTSSEV